MTSSWKRVSPGTVIETGTPHKIVYPHGLLGKRTVPLATIPQEWYIEEILKLPTEPTVGIALHRDGLQWYATWKVLGDHLRTVGETFPQAWPVDEVVDFVTLTPEQAKRLNRS